MQKHDVFSPYLGSSLLDVKRLSGKDSDLITRAVALSKLRSCPWRFSLNLWVWQLYATLYNYTI